jgi:hypothetical protein
MWLREKRYFFSAAVGALQYPEEEGNNSAE